MGLKITPNDDYQHFVQGILGLIEKYNQQYRTKEHSLEVGRRIRQFVLD